jgi:hypothetical protein
MSQSPIDRFGPVKTATTPTIRAARQHQNEAEWIDAIISGRNYHVASARLVGAWARRGMLQIEARARLVQIFKKVPKMGRDPRWRTRREDIGRVVSDIYIREAETKNNDSELADELQLTRQCPFTVTRRP